MAEKRHPPRLSVLLASEAPVGLILRRGPTKLVQVVVWNRANDKFKPGPLFKGRIFANRSGLSPDGRYLIYFAMGGVAWAMPETGGTWTAIARLPSLKAIALWRRGDTRAGGGMFTSNRSFWLNADENTVLIRDNTGLRREAARPGRPAAEGNGWVWNKEIAGGRVFEKAIHGGWILRRLARSGGYELEHLDEGRIAFPAWEWAEWDRRRLVWAADGCLRAASLGSHKLGCVHTLSDFNATLLHPSKRLP